jgi:hypothetical protein
MFFFHLFYLYGLPELTSRAQQIDISAHNASELGASTLFLINKLFSDRIDIFPEISCSADVLTKSLCHRWLKVAIDNHRIGWERCSFILWPTIL